MQTTWKNWSLSERALSLACVAIAITVAILQWRGGATMSVAEMLEMLALVTIPLSWAFMPSIFLTPLGKGRQIPPNSPPAMGMVAFFVILALSILARLAGL